MSGSQGRSRRSLEQVPGRLDAVEPADCQRPLDRLSLARAARGKPDQYPGGPQRSQLLAHLGVVEDAALQCRGMDLVQTQMAPEQRSGLGELAAERGRGQVLDLVLVDVDSP